MSPARLVVALIISALIPAAALASDRCTAPDDGSGTVVFPPLQCGYPGASPSNLYLIVDGLPPGTEIEIVPLHLGFHCALTGDPAPCLVEAGGNLGGERELFDAVVVMEMTGTGDLDGFHRILSMPLSMESHTAPRTPGDPVQAFDTDLFQLQGTLFGDPDFAQLQLTAGTGFGLPSPGHTTLTQLPSGDFNVDSFFDISYQIDFQGAPGGALAGLAGSTQGTVLVNADAPADRCVAPDDGTGTVELPPGACDYFAGMPPLQIVDGLPIGTSLELTGRLGDYVCTGPCGQPGGNLGGEREDFDATGVFELRGTDKLEGYRRIIRLPMAATTDSAPRVPGDPVQAFPAELFGLQGALFGDPDFDFLEITAGSDNGLPSPGHTTLIERQGGDFIVDSFFDISYQIEFTGAPGGLFDGLSGTTTASSKIDARAAGEQAVEPDDGGGTVTLPPLTSLYKSSPPLRITDGLPPGTSIELDARLLDPTCPTPGCGVPGGALGGESETFSATLELSLRGTGSLIGFERLLEVPVDVETHSAPRVGGEAVQSFDTDLFSLSGSLFGDPDFDQLLIQAGADHALPSPGSTSLSELPSGDFIVDSFFDIAYRIDFVGAPGGALDGLAGTTTDSSTLRVCDDPSAPATGTITIVKDAQPDSGQDFSFTGDLGNFLLDDDGDPTLADRRNPGSLAAGTYTVTEAAVAGWILTGIFCDDPDGGTATTGLGEVTIDLDPGENIVCTFVNVDLDDVIFGDGFESGDTSAWSSP